MGDLTSKDGRYYTVEQGDGNFVVYDRTIGSPWTAVWDRWSYEAALGQPLPAQPAPAAPELPFPAPTEPPSAPSGGMPLGLPSGRGAFRLPGYPARIARITEAGDGMVRPVGMAYWPNINNHAGSDELLVLAAINDTLTIFAVHKGTFHVALRSVLPYAHTGEGCYWSFRDPNLLYIPMLDGSRLVSYNISSGSERTIVAPPGGLRQPHSSYDGRVHSFTSNGGAAVSIDGTIRTFAPEQGYDECQVDKIGRWLNSKEGSDNRIIDLQSGQQWWIRDREGALGHSDMGFGYMVGEEDQSDPGGCFRVWVFGEGGPQAGPLVYCTGWQPMSRYASHCNARPGDWSTQRMLFSSEEIGLVTKYGDEVVTVCPSLTDSGAPGGWTPDGGNYWKKARANICPNGRYAAWSGNHGSDRIDVFVADLLSV